MSMTCTLRRVSDAVIEALRSEPEGILEEVEREVPDGDQQYLDKAWHGLHFLLGGDLDEHSLLGFLMAGGEEVGEVDVGYGPARALDSAEVEALDEELSAITEHELRAKFDPARMLAAKIYPPIWDRDPAEDDVLAWLVGYFVPLQQLVAQAARAHQGLLIWLS